MKPLPWPLAARFYLSLLVAATALYAGFRGDDHDAPEAGFATDVAWTLGFAWIVLFAESMVRFRERTMILLVGAPFALFWLLIALTQAGR
jgi:hypothetical protein